MRAKLTPRELELRRLGCSKFTAFLIDSKFVYMILMGKRVTGMARDSGKIIIEWPLVPDNIWRGQNRSIASN